LTEEIVNGPINDVRVATNRAEFSKDLSVDNAGFLQVCISVGAGFIPMVVKLTHVRCSWIKLETN
jgi:hypothetical protein